MPLDQDDIDVFLDTEDFAEAATVAGASTRPDGQPLTVLFDDPSADGGVGGEDGEIEGTSPAVHIPQTHIPAGASYGSEVVLVDRGRTFVVVGIRSQDDDATWQVLDLEEITE